MHIFRKMWLKCPASREHKQFKQNTEVRLATDEGCEVWRAPAAAEGPTIPRDAVALYLGER